MNTRNSSRLYATDQHEERSASPSGQSGSSTSRASSAMLQLYPMTPMSTSSSPGPQAGTFSRVSPQLSGAQTNVAPIYAGASPMPPQHLGLGSITPSSRPISVSPHPNKFDIYRLLPDNKIIMDTQVRQFYASDGASFIEHVPGHCLVFLPNTANIGYAVREMRRIRPQRPRPKPRSGKAKPTNAFIKYRNHKIKELKERYPDISQTEISRMAGRCWEIEDENVKIEFRKLYLEDKRIYDMNKAKRQCTGTGIAFGSEGATQGILGSTSSIPSDSNGSGSTLDLGLGFGSDGRPAGFNTGRRRSHTLPPGDFSRSRAKRRISQELRKHLANKNNAYYTAVAASTDSPIIGADNSFVPSNGYVSGESSTSSSSVMGNGAEFLFGNAPTSHDQQHQQYEFTFTAPPPDMQMASTSAQSSSSTIGIDLSSPYLGYDSSAMAMPLNPSFPIAEFSDANGTISHSTHGYSRSLTNIGAGVSLGPPAFTDANAHCNQDGLAPFVSSANSFAKSIAGSSIATSLPLINTSNIVAFSNDSMPIDGFSAGYMGANTAPLDAASCSLPPSSAYAAVPSSHSQQQ
ncbi:hypothetical protein IW140_000113 [Coemansia sp. RSA 1813]|nr:hypothetical protein EV178_000083 [Coemansia sp. RSA 1646]KAJ1771501.1 hypothetical protein LPJ74_002321 [Coemansia sp. RSA 1843]KAJ2093218.1 hypothetical protein IW138_000511 [Coemansia sp. RSA 986]KAJ2217517.1 hypothetical protein EV179_000351 [Coemansia sp. RSA 487]KAJ2573471.1 hypothetical protein IW140_000113 [Coemansia sp. RSA 1813]